MKLITPETQSQMRILVIDDDEAIRELLAALLADLGEVDIAEDGEAGLVLANNLTPDVILLDVTMPRMDGYEVCRRLKASTDTADIPVIFVTGNNNKEDEEKALLAGGVDFVSKPIYPSILRMRVNNQLKIQQMTNSLIKIASTDALTGAYNRRHFSLVVENELHRSKRYGLELSMMMIDIDHFKLVNDTHGHGVGDEALKKTVDVIFNALRSEDTLGRIGGEEFAVLMPETKIKSAVALAERLREGVGQITLDTSTEPLSWTVSIGVTEVIAADHTLTSALNNADKFLYAAKESGRNCVIGPNN